MERYAPSPATVWGAEGRLAIAAVREAQTRVKRWRAALELGRQVAGGTQDNTLLEGGDFGFPAGKGTLGLGAVDQLNTDLQALTEDAIAALDNAG